MKLKRTVVAPVLVAVVALVTGGWLLQRGAGEQNNVYQQARVFDEVLHLLSDRHVEGRPSSELYKLAVDGLIREFGDPHTTFLTPEDYRELYMQMAGEYGGIGAQVGERDGWATIISPLPGTPAERAGVRAGDRIVEINGTSTRGISNDEVVKILRGPAGEAVTIGVMRPAVDEMMSFRIVREEIHLQAVPYAFLLGDGVGYIRLSVFNGTSTDEVRAAMEKLRAGGMQKLILDLRENPGGLLEQGVGVSDLFLKRGEAVVETRSRTRRESLVARASGEEAYPGIPVVVLVDDYSASAAEIVAGALQDHDRALVVGTTTFGKGSVQDLVPLSGGNFLKITTAKWFTPSGRSIQKELVKDGEAATLLADSDAPVDQDGRPIPAANDTTTRQAFRTDAGRVVYGGGGIVPDLLLLPDTLSMVEKELARAIARGGTQKYFNVVFGYAVDYTRTHPRLRPDFQSTPEMRAELLTRLRAAGLEITSEQFEDGRRLIDRQLVEEIARQKFDASVVAQRRNASDRVVQGALDLLRGVSSQAALFQAAQTRKTPIAGS